MHPTSPTDSALTVLHNATIVPGDGATLLEDATLVMAGGRITRISRDREPPSRLLDEGATVVDVDGDVVMPGIINAHMHQAFSTPFTAAAAPVPNAETVAETLDRHLLEGCTTVLNADSFALASERDSDTANHPLKVEYGSCATPSTKEAAVESGGELDERHQSLTIPEAVTNGALLLGEVGSKNTLTGGIQREKYIPEKLAARFGVELQPDEAQRIVDAAIGRHADPNEQDESAVGDVLGDMDLQAEIDATECQELIVDTVMPSIHATRDGFREVGDFAAALGVPMLVHTSAVTKRATQELARRDLQLVTGHINHPSFEADEMFALAEEMNATDGVTVEACVWDLFGEDVRPGFDVTEHQGRFLDLIERDLVDVISTDFANGFWHGLLLAIRAIVERDVLSVPAAIALVTGNVARLHPAIGATRGTLEAGKAADVLVVDREDLGLIRSVFVDGQPVVADGEILDQGC